MFSTQTYYKRSLAYGGIYLSTVGNSSRAAHGDGAKHLLFFLRGDGAVHQDALANVFPRHVGEVWFLMLSTQMLE